MVKNATTIPAQYEPAREAVAHYGARLEVDGPLTMHELRMVLMNFEDLKVPDDAVIYVGFPMISAHWKR